MSLSSLFEKALKHHLNRNYNDALILYKKIISLDSDFAEAHNNLGLIYYEFGDKKNSLQSYLKAIEINQNFFEAHTNLGGLFVELGNYYNAINHCEKAIKIQPLFAKAHCNLGWAYDELGDHPRAIGYYKKSLENDPDLVGAHNNLGSLYKDIGEYDKAICCYKRAIEIDQNYFKARKNLGLVLLLLSNFIEGFKEFEYRIKDTTKKEYQELKLQSSIWKGENLDKKVILLLSEQGIGDIIHFARYLYQLKATYNVKIIFRTDKKLFHFFEDSEIQLISEEDNIPKHDYYTYLLSLANIYYQKEKILFQQIFYIKKNETSFLKWKKKLSNIKLPKIGINWQGNKNYKADKFRSIPLIFFETLFDIKGLAYINLQKGFGEEQIENFKHKDKLYNFSYLVDTGNNSFEDTIEIIRNMDLVITSSTAIAHISSTIGIKTWALVPYSPDWTWFLKKNDTPWYKNTRLFRQNKLNDWSNVFDEVKSELIKEFQIQLN